MKKNTSSDELDEILKAYSTNVQELLAGVTPFDDGLEAPRWRKEAKQSIEAYISKHYILKADVATYLERVRLETSENIEYITGIEGVEIPKVWQEKILMPLDFASAQIRESLNLEGENK